MGNSRGAPLEEMAVLTADPLVKQELDFGIGDILDRREFAGKGEGVDLLLFGWGLISY